MILDLQHTKHVLSPPVSSLVLEIPFGKKIFTGSTLKDGGQECRNAKNLLFTFYFATLGLILIGGKSPGLESVCCLVNTMNIYLWTQLVALKL